MKERKISLYETPRQRGGMTAERCLAFAGMIAARNGGSLGEWGLHPRLQFERKRPAEAHIHTYATHYDVTQTQQSVSVRNDFRLDYRPVQRETLQQAVWRTEPLPMVLAPLQGTTLLNFEQRWQSLRVERPLAQQAVPPAAVIRTGEKTEGTALQFAPFRREGTAEAKAQMASSREAAPNAGHSEAHLHFASYKEAAGETLIKEVEERVVQRLESRSHAIEQTQTRETLTREERIFRERETREMGERVYGLVMKKWEREMRRKGYLYG